MSRLTLPGPQALIFVAGGVLSAVVDIGLLQLLAYNGTAPLLATSAGFVAGLCVNYAFHAKVTFKNVTTLRTLSRYLCVVALNYLMTLGLVAISVTFIGLPLVGKLVSLPLVAVNGFFLSKHWIFK